jgi:CRISPR-associated protein Csd1
VILTKLYELSQRKSEGSEGIVVPSMYNRVRIRWLIEIDAQGNFKGFSGPLDADKKRKGQEYIMPDLIRAAGIKPKLLADNGEYVLGLVREGGDATKVAARHQQFKDLVILCAEKTQDPAVLAVAHFLNNWNPEQEVPTELDPTDNITFAVRSAGQENIIPASAAENWTAIQEFWANYTAGADSPIMTCLVTGKEAPVDARLPVKIKGIPNGQTAGTSLVSANAAPFMSYGLENSLTSPISREAGEGFGKALNDLIASPDSHLRCDPVMYVFWTKEPVSPSLGLSYKRDQPKTIKTFLQSAKRGEPSAIGSKQNRFYALSLTASGGRTVVRNWLEVPIPEAAAALESWFDAQEIVDSFGKTTDTYFNTYRLASAMYRDASSEMEASALCDFNEVALKGGKLGLRWLAKVVKRCAIKPNPTFNSKVVESTIFERAALIKLILTTQMQTNEANPMADLQELNLDPQFEGYQEADRPIVKAAYQLGRLLAQLDNLQKAALGDVNTTLIDRYYSAAAATPGKVFGELLKDSQAHFRKLRVTKPGTYEALQQKLEEVLCKIPADKWPNTLTMQQQGLFSLGYYHQRAFNRKQAIDRKAENDEKAAIKAAETTP